MNSEVELAIKEYYDINEKIKQLEKRKSELKEELYSVFDSRKINELKAENILLYRVNRPRISWDESILKSILIPKGLWESAIAPDNNKVRSLIEKKLILENEINNAKITVDSWYTYAKQVSIEQGIQHSKCPSNIEEIKGIRRLVITDLSKMKEDRICIFGIDSEGRNIRPEIPYSQWIERDIFDENGKIIIQPLAEIEFDFIQSKPKPPHTEDVEINRNYKPRLIRNLSESEGKILFEGILDDSIESIFCAVIHENKYLNHGEGKRSLGTIRMKECLGIKHFKKDDEKYSFRIQFSDMKGEIYDLKITDYLFNKYYNTKLIEKNLDSEIICNDILQRFNKFDVFLRVGIARPFEKMYNRCYLQVSGIHSFPDYREKEYENKVVAFDIQNNSFTQEKNFDKEMEILLNDINAGNRAHVAYLLGESKNPSFVEILCKATKDLDGNVRRMAASALGKIGDMHAIDALICLLFDDKPQVRQYAIKALGDIGNEKAIPELMKFRDDPIPYIKKAIDIAIKKIKKLRADSSSINVHNENFDPNLFEILRGLRKELAEKEGISSFIIFYDISLKAMATHFPKDLQTLGNIEGVDETNLRKYGELFLQEISSYCKNHKIEPKSINELGSNPKSTTIIMQTPTSSKTEIFGADIVRVGISKREIIGTLKKIIQVSQHDKEAAHLEDIIFKAEIVGIDKDAVKDVIQLLKRTGEIYEVSNERFRIVE
jgi:hypothetical protein